jgi:hypothetical protein
MEDYTKVNKYVEINNNYIRQYVAEYLDIHPGEQPFIVNRIYFDEIMSYRLELLLDKEIKSTLEELDDYPTHYGIIL